MYPSLDARFREAARALGIADGPRHDRLGKAVHAALLAFVSMPRAEQERWVREAAADREADRMAPKKLGEAGKIAKDAGRKALQANPQGRHRRESAAS